MNNIIYDVDQETYFKKNRIVFLYGEINPEKSLEVCAKMKYLNYLDNEKEIILEINSPGGEVSSGLAIIDVIKTIESPVKTVVCGMAASMAALIATSGDKGRRCAFPHSTIMIHQPLGGMGIAQASDIEIYSKNIVKTKKILNTLLSDATGKPIEIINKDTDRDNHMTAAEALEYGLIDVIIAPKKRLS